MTSSTFLPSGRFTGVENKNAVVLVKILDKLELVSANLNDYSRGRRYWDMLSVKIFILNFHLTLPFDVSLEFS